MNPTNSSKLTGALIGALALTGSVFGLTAVAGANDGEPTLGNTVETQEETFEAEMLDELPADAEIIDIDDLSSEVDLGDVEGETFEAEQLDELPADAEIIDVEDLDAGDWNEQSID